MERPMMVASLFAGIEVAKYWVQDRGIEPVN